MVQRIPNNGILANAIALSRLVRAGISGQVLTSNGAGADASWQNVPAQLVLPRGYIDGFILSNDSTDPTNDILVSAGQARDATNAQNIENTVSVLKQLDVVFAEYSNPATASGGRDSADNLTGAKWFNVFIIWGAGKNAQPFFSTSSTPTLPSGFTHRRRVGSINWTGSAIRTFTQLNDEFLWNVPIWDANSVGVAVAGQLLTLTVPTGVKVRALVSAGVVEASRGFALDSTDVPATAVSAAGTPKTAGQTISISNEATGTIAISPHWPLRTDTNGQVRARTSNATNMLVLTRGYIDPRGKE